MTPNQGTLITVIMITTTNPKIMNEIQRMIRGNKKNQDC